MLKRCFDFCLGLMLLLLLFPVLFGISALILVTMGRPIFFVQRRPGYKGKIFNIYKFRTMTTEKDETMSQSDAVRLTKVGRILRGLSLDELPELYNILRGDMSFVGPRPLLEHYLELYNDFQMRRHDVLPGLTGWAQVNGRNDISWQKKFELDIWYVENQSFWLDLKILFVTAFKVFKREGVTKSGCATTENFKGND